MKGILTNHRGVALLLTVSITALLVVSALELHRKVLASLISADMRKDRQIIREMAASGIHTAMAILVADKKESNVDSLQEDWADPEAIKTIVDTLSFDDGKLSVEIHDERSRIQINALVTTDGGRSFNEPQRRIWERYLTALASQSDAFEESDHTAIINALKDWLDSGDDDAITGLTGAETDYYQDLDPPYECRNGAMRHPGELMRIKGISPDMYHGVQETPGMKEMVTVFGRDVSGSTVSASASPWYGGKINIFTAPLPVIQALLPTESEEIAQSIIDYREAKDGDVYLHELSDINGMIKAIGLTDSDIDTTQITAASDIYRIVATGSLDEMKTTITAVVRREQDSETGKWNCRVLSWKAE